MEGYFLEVRVVFHTLKPLGIVLLVLGSDISGHSRHAACLLLRALEDDLYPIAFCFLCHNDRKFKRGQLSLLPVHP